MTFIYSCITYHVHLFKRSKNRIECFICHYTIWLYIRISQPNGMKVDALPLLMNLNPSACDGGGSPQTKREHTNLQNLLLPLWGNSANATPLCHRMRKIRQVQDNRKSTICGYNHGHVEHLGSHSAVNLEEDGRQQQKSTQAATPVR